MTNSACSRTELLTGFGNYCSLLQLLMERRLLRDTAIYPAIGVDAIPALFADKLVGVNLVRYDSISIIDHLAPVIPPPLLPQIVSALNTRLAYVSQIDVSSLRLVAPILNPYRGSSKSLLLKGIFEYVFRWEWDSDTERFHRSTEEGAHAKAAHWLRGILSWLDINDVLVVFDRNLFLQLASVPHLTEIDLGLRDRGPGYDVTYVNTVPIVSLPHYVKVFARNDSVLSAPALPIFHRWPRARHHRERII